jgi:pyridoxine/pyridoxamine 5'-phosphate oxidase
MTRADIYHFLAKEKLGVLGTLSPDGRPQSALVGIAVTSELEIIFDTVKSSRKYRNLVSNPLSSFVVGWAGECTIQYEGEAYQPEGNELATYQEMYFSRWPDGPSRLAWPGITYFVVRPRWIRYSDFDQNPPLIEEFNFPNPGMIV